MSADADVVIGAGDFAGGSIHEGRQGMIAALAAIETPTVLVPGNNETVDALRDATSQLGGGHGPARRRDGDCRHRVLRPRRRDPREPPWEWSFDLDEEEAAGMLAPCPEGAVLVLHSPPQGALRQRRRRHPLRQLGAAARRSKRSGRGWRSAATSTSHGAARGEIGSTPVRNLGPTGTWIEL